MIYKFLNGKTLVIEDIKSLEKSFFNKNDNSVPYVVLITAWDRLSCKIERLSNLITSLILKGTKNFVCVGRYSELLHDQIDEIIYLYYFKNNISETVDIITSFQGDETLEDIVNCYVFWEDIGSNKSNYLLALLNYRIREDNNVINELKKQVSLSENSGIAK